MGQAQGDTLQNKPITTQDLTKMEQDIVALLRKLPQDEVDQIINQMHKQITG